MELRSGCRVERDESIDSRGRFDEFSDACYGDTPALIHPERLTLITENDGNRSRAYRRPIRIGPPTSGSWKFSGECTYGQTEPSSPYGFEEEGFKDEERVRWLAAIAIIVVVIVAVAALYLSTDNQDDRDVVPRHPVRYPGTMSVESFELNSEE